MNEFCREKERGHKRENSAADSENVNGEHFFSPFLQAVCVSVLADR